MKVSKNFRAEEFLPPEIFSSYGESSIWFIDKRTVDLAQFVRDFFQRSVTINNWHSGGSFKERGFRVPESKTGQRLSQHKYCRAVDFTVAGISPSEVKSTILHNSAKFLAVGMTTMESENYTPTWTHIDIRWTGLDSILIVKPPEINALMTEENEYFTWEDGEFVPTQLPKFLGK